jgi:hypothetical protein
LLAPFLQDGINLLPKIRKQSGGVPIGIKANSLPGMVAVVMLDARPSTGSRSLANRVGIVEAKQAHAAFIVQRQRVGEAMRAFRCRWHPSHLELDPMHSRLVGEKCFPIEKQESIKTLVAICQADKLSTVDNQVKVIFAFSASFLRNAALVSTRKVESTDRCKLNPARRWQICSSIERISATWQTMNPTRPGNAGLPRGGSQRE